MAEYLQDAPLDFEARRIAALPMVGAPDAAAVEAWSRHLCHATAWHDPAFRGLFPMQAQALAEYYTYGALVAPSLRVSGGKALIAWACSAISSYHFQIPKIIILVPAKTSKNFWQREQKKARMWVKGIPRAFWYTGKNVKVREEQAAKAGVHVLTEGLVQSATGRDLIRKINPGAWIIDEAHNFSRTDAARTRRLLGLIHEEKVLLRRDIKVVALSATMGTKGKCRSWRLFELALGQNSPLPTSESAAQQMESETDPFGGQRPLHYVPAAGSAQMDPITSWAVTNVAGFPQEYDTKARRYALRLRQYYTPGVVIDMSKQDRTPTNIHRIDCGPLNARGLELWNLVINGTKPSGDKMSSSLDRHKYQSQLTCGYYTELVWPSAKVYAARSGQTEDVAEYQLAAAVEEVERHNEYRKHLYKTLAWLGDNPVDTPMSMGRYFEDFRRDRRMSDRFKDLFKLYKKWKDFLEKHPNLPERDKVPVLVDDYKIRASVEWAKQGPGLLWVFHDCLFDWTYQYLRQAGIKPYVCRSGDPKAMAYVMHKRDPSQLYLIKSGGYNEGIELDYMHRALYLEWRRSAVDMEQTLGRMDRTNQKNASLEISHLQSNEFDLAQISATLAQAAKDREENAASHLLLESKYHPPLEKLTDSAEMAKIFSDFNAADMNMQLVLDELNAN